MYNRYIPQSDGTYRRNRMPEPQREIPRSTPAQQPPSCDPPPREPENPGCRNCPHAAAPRRPAPPKPRKNTTPAGVGSFLKQLLPKNFDTEDLLIVLLLLLMAGDCQEDQNSALLTLVLYLFM